VAGVAYLIRHAKAGDRTAWRQPDALRPLSRPGRRQAEAIADQLGGEPIARVLSSPAQRCVETVRPLAVRLGVPLEEADPLSEGAGPSGAHQLARSVVEGSAVALCSHGDVIWELLADLEDAGVPLSPGRPAKKGSTWLLEVRDGAIVRGTYLPPPTT
jgi:broad specificity phosphatase PhoE